jgi:hypothetical protein
MLSFKEYVDKKVYIHIDDERPPKPGSNAVWLKNYSEALNWVNSLSENSNISRVNFDNDIADTHPGHDGYHILKKLLDKVLEGMNMPEEIMIHTQNQINRKNMIIYIQNFCKAREISYSTENEKYMVHNKELDRDLLVDGIVFKFQS